jgi:outer membrane protein TolC
MRLKSIFLFLAIVKGLLFAQSDNLYSSATNELLSQLQSYYAQYDEDTHSLKIVGYYKYVDRRIPENLQDNLEDILKLLLAYKEYVKKITIVGHASSESSVGKTDEEKYLRNLLISQNRADNVLEYVKELSKSFSKVDQNWINTNFFTIGKSFSEPILDKNGEEVSKLSRRVEFIIRLKTIYQKFDNKVIRLSSYVHDILENYPSVKEKYFLVQSLQQELNKNQAAFYPTLDFNYKYSDYSKSDDDHYDNTESIDLTLRYNIFKGFSDLEQNNIDEYNIESNRYLKEQVESDLIKSLIEAYTSIQKQKEILDLAYSNLDDYKTWMQKEDIKFQSGLVTLNAYAKVQSRYITQKINLEELKAEYKKSIIKMQKYINLGSDDTNYFEKLVPKSEYFTNKAIAFEDLFTKAPSIKEADANIAMYQAKIDQSKSGFYPKVDFVAQTKVSDEEYDNNTATKNNLEENKVSLEASFNLFSGGKNLTSYKKAFFEYRQKLQKKEEIKKELAYNLKKEYHQLDLENKKFLLFKELVQKREESYSGAKYDYKFAKIDAETLLDAVDDLYSARRRQIENRYELQIIKYSILGEVGVLKEYIIDKDTISKE